MSTEQLTSCGSYLPLCWRTVSLQKVYYLVEQVIYRRVLGNKSLITLQMKKCFTALKRSFSKKCRKFCISSKTLSIQSFPNYYFFTIPSSQTIESNWRCGRHSLQRIHCRSETSKGVYCLQYDDQKIVSGLRDNTIKVRSLQLWGGS